MTADESPKRTVFQPSLYPPFDHASQASLTCTYRLHKAKRETARVRAGLECDRDTGQVRKTISGKQRCQYDIQRSSESVTNDIALFLLAVDHSLSEPDPYAKANPLAS
jgi:hypothetical protein